MNLSAKNETKISYTYDVLDKTKEFNNSQVVVKSGDKKMQPKKSCILILLKQNIYF